MLTNYKILSATSQDALEEIVEKWLDADWELGHFATAVLPNYVVYYQTMTKTRPNKRDYDL